MRRSLPARLRRPLVRSMEAVFARFADILLQRADERLLHPHRYLLAEAQREAAEYVKAHMAGALVFRTGAEVLALALARMNAAGMVLEFGVAAGDSIRFLAARTTRPIHGFDSFEGLPADWGGRHEARGHYSTGGAPPAVPAHVTLHKGPFAETLPAFLEAHADAVALVHIDCDLYASTRTVLELLAPRLGPGTVIVFDEYFNFVSWKEHEFRAFQEFVRERGIGYRYLCWAYQQVAVVIEGAGPD